MVSLNSDALGAVLSFLPLGTGDCTNFFSSSKALYKTKDDHLKSHGELLGAVITKYQGDFSKIPETKKKPLRSQVIAACLVTKSLYIGCATTQKSRCERLVDIIAPRFSNMHKEAQFIDALAERCPKLRELVISSPDITSATIRALANRLPNLELLGLQKTQNIWSDAITERSFPSLVSLSLKGSKISTTIEHYQLKQLDVSYSSGFDFDSFSYSRRRYTQLTTLDIRGLRVAEYSQEYVLASFTALERLITSRCLTQNEPFYTQIQNQHPNLVIERVESSSFAEKQRAVKAQHLQAIATTKRWTYLKFAGEQLFFAGSAALGAALSIAHLSNMLTGFPVFVIEPGILDRIGALAGSILMSGGCLFVTINEFQKRSAELNSLRGCEQETRGSNQSQWDTKEMQRRLQKFSRR